MAPPAPVRLTTAMGWPRSFDAPSASLRASRSAALPAPKSTVSSSGLVGNACAHAVDATARIRMAIGTIRRVITLLRVKVSSRLKDHLDRVADALLDDLEAALHLAEREIGRASRRVRVLSCVSWWCVC